MVDKRSNIQPADLKYKPHRVKGLKDIIDCAIGVHFYPPPGSEHYKILCLEKLYGYNHINDKHRKTMRQKWRALYNVLHQTCAGKLRTKIASLTTYNRVN